MRILDELTLEQYAMIAVAERDGYLDEVPDEYGKRLRWAVTGDPTQQSRLDNAARTALAPRFAQALVDLVGCGWIEVRAAYSGRWHDTSAMSADDLVAAVADPGSWIPPSGGRQSGLTITATDRWKVVRRTD